MLGAWRKSKFTHIIRAFFLLISQIGCDDHGAGDSYANKTAVRQTLQLNGGIRWTNKIHKT